jgi:N-acetylglucosamine-6-phosphate deacetylase
VQSTHIITSSRIFTGKEWLTDHAVIITDHSIADIVPLSSLDSTLIAENFNDAIIAPAFIDLQIYGAYGKLLAVYPEAASLYKLNEYCNKGGAAFCLPTVATNTKEIFHQCIDAVKAYWQQGGKGILGLHLEGPWINPTKRGAHIEELIHEPTIEEVKEVLAYGKEVIKMITLAPECCSREVLDLIRSEGIIISAGHSNASYAEAKDAFGYGITTVTHLFNAMSPLQHREPGLVGAVMDDAITFASIIPDGYHVDFAAARIAKQVMKERLFVITDAVTETDKGAYPHTLNGEKYEASGILSGSALTMAKAVKNLVENKVTDIGEALRMCSLYPAKVAGLDNSLGKIEKGYKSCLVILDEHMSVLKLIS